MSKKVKRNNDKMNLIKSAAGINRNKMDFQSMPHNAVFQDRRRRSLDRAIAKEMKAC